MNLKSQLSLCSLLIVSVGMMTSCQRTQQTSAEQTATQFGQAQGPLEEGAEASATAQSPLTQPTAPETGRNRFGFAGGDNPVKPLRRDTQNYTPAQEKPKLKERVSNLKKEVAQTPKFDKKIDAPKPPPAPAATSPIVKLGFANKVAGDSLHVTLPNEYASLGPVSVEKMDPAGNSLGSPWPRGTQMQIPNPKVSGGKIYFKVP